MDQATLVQHQIDDAARLITELASEGFAMRDFAVLVRNTEVIGDFTAAFKAVDVILAPSTPSAAFAVGEKMDDPIAMYLNDVFTVPANLAGLPGISLPAGLSEDGLPLGLQIIGRAFDEETVLKAAAALEVGAGFSHRPSFITARPQ